MNSETVPLLYSKDPGQLHLWFVGGCGVFGMNLTIYVYLERYFIVDAGLLFPPEHLLGTDCIIPDLTSFAAVHGPPAAYIITHGHEDHIGALPFLLARWPAPVYGPAWAMELVSIKLPKDAAADLRTVTAGEVLTLGEVTFGWLHVNHSLPMTCSLTVETGAGRVFHSGDFKYDPSPPFEEKTDFAGITAWGAKGVDVLITDSTNAPSPGWGPSEASVGPALEELIVNAEGRIYISTFASNLWRLLTILKLARKHQKKVAISGAGLHKTLKIAVKLEVIGQGLLDELVDEEEFGRFPRYETLAVVTGCQGEHRSALARLAAGKHAKWQIEAGDRVIFSSRFIPGNEGAIFHMISQMTFQGAQCITAKSHPGIHVSGHAHKEEIEWLVHELKPRYYVPVHGTHLQLAANQALGTGTVIKVENGSILKLAHHTLKAVKVYTPELLYVDSWSKIPLEYDTLRERLKIGDSGLIHLKGVFSRSRGEWRSPLKVDLIGTALPLHVEFSIWMKETVDLVGKTILESPGTEEQATLDAVVAAVKRRATLSHVKKPVVIAAIYFD